MKNLVLSCVFSLLFLPACSLWHSDEKKDTSINSSSPLVNLLESTHIIQTLIAQNKLGCILEDYDPEQLNILLNNVSPAKMAFESEVFATTVPLSAVYYYKENAASQAFIKQLEGFAEKYDNQVKFVVVDAEKLFSLAQDADIEKLPTLLFIRDREIIDRFEKDINVSQFESILACYMQKLDN